MEGTVIKGELTYFNTSKGMIHIKDEVDGADIFLDITAATQLSEPLNWEDLIGREVEAIVIDDKTKEIYLTEEE